MEPAQPENSGLAINTRIFDSFPVLKTDRLTLREIRPQDAGAIFDMRSNHRVNTFIARDGQKEIEQSKELVERTTDAYHSRKGIGWAGILRDKEEIIGTCGFNRIEYENLRAEIGGELSTRYWGKQVAAEAVEAIVGFGLREMNLQAIEAKVDPANRGAIHLLNQMGFEQEALYAKRIYYRGSFRDMAVYTLHKGNEQLTL